MEKRVLFDCQIRYHENVSQRIQIYVEGKKLFVHATGTGSTKPRKDEEPVSCDFEADTFSDIIGMLSGSVVHAILNFPDAGSKDLLKQTTADRGERWFPDTINQERVLEAALSSLSGGKLVKITEKQARKVGLVPPEIVDGTLH